MGAGITVYETPGSVSSDVATAHVRVVGDPPVPACMRGRRTGRTGGAIAAAVIASENLVFAATGFRCPLTTVAESLGVEHGSVTDLYLPAGCARNRLAIGVALLGRELFVHGRNLRRSFRTAPLAARAQLRWQATFPAGDCW